MDPRFQLDGRSHRERMLTGDQYIADDPDLARESLDSFVVAGRGNP